MKIKSCDQCRESYEVPLYRSVKSHFCSSKCYHDSRKGISMPDKFHKAKEKWLKDNRDKHIKMLKDRGFSAENNPFWKGDNATYGQKHRWIGNNYTHSPKCEECGSTLNLEWSNISHNYYRVRSDWQTLCRSCHMKFDKNIHGIRRGRELCEC